MKSKRSLDRTGSQKPGFYDNSSLSPADLEKPGFFLEGNLRLGGAGFWDCQLGAGIVGEPAPTAISIDPATKY